MSCSTKDRKTWSQLQQWWNREWTKDHAW
jgi:hypothetical protein